MAPKKQQRSRKKNGRMIVRGAPAMPSVRQRRPVSNEEKLLRLIMDPCEAEMAHGYALSTEGIVQRFTQYYTPTATTETSFSYAVFPTFYNTGGVYQNLGSGTGAIGTTVTAQLPGQTFLDANADTISTLAACVEVLYTGTVVNRKGYIAVAQGNTSAIIDAVSTATNTFSGLVALSNAAAPIPSSTVAVRWSPTVSNFNGSANAAETSAITSTNGVLVTAVGVNPSDFVVRVTIVYEYTPKIGLGQPLARVSRTTPPGVGERITSALDRYGHWWHNVGMAAAAASRMGNQVFYGAGQVAGFARGVIRTGRAATTLLALAG